MGPGEGKAHLTSEALIEISLTVDGEAAEAVCELFDTRGGGAVVEIREPAVEGGQPEVTVRTYLAAADTAARARVEEGLWHLGRIVGLPEAIVRELAEADWALEWRRHYTPQRIGTSFLVVPSWLEAPHRAGDRVIVLDPGMAFGTGLHPTTRLCLAAVERLARTGMSMLDVGTGSGILAIGAALIGARPVVACDTDPRAAEVAADNARINGVAVGVVAGGVTDIAPGAFDLVVANILAGTLCDLASDLAPRVAAGGTLVASGVLDTQSGEVTAAMTAAGLEPAGVSAEKDWVALEFARGDNMRPGKRLSASHP